MKFLTLLAAAPFAISAPVLAPRGEVVPGHWIAVLKPQGSRVSTLGKITETLGVEHLASYAVGAFRGIKLSAESDELLNAIASLSDIAYIEPDYKVTINELATQSGATWGLARLSSREPGAADYVYDSSAGQGTFAYIIDTGIFTSHPEFEGRAVFGTSLVEGEDNEDGHGHGTHVSGTVGSRTWGVAKKTNLIAVKVLGADGSGTTSQVIAGMQWAVEDATAKGRIGKSVANLSLGGLRTGSASNDAAAAMVEAGIFLSVAAGNDGLPADLYSPASEPTVCTVGATEANDRKATFSNYGPLIDVFAPGVGITSTWNNGSTATISGTSMAAPHIAGLGAYLLGLEGEREPIPLCERIQELATKNVVSESLSTNNILAYNGASDE